MTIVGSELREALFHSQMTLERIAHTEATNMAEVRERIVANRAALASSAPRDGWVMVPREPTEEMLEAGKDARLGMAPGNPPGVALAMIYRAMIDAAPSVGEG